MTNQQFRIPSGAREIGHPQGLNASEFITVGLPESMIKSIPVMVDKMKVEPLPEKPKPSHLKVVT